MCLQFAANAHALSDMVVNTSGILAKTKRALELKKAETEGLSSRMATSEREVALLKQFVEEAEKTKQTLRSSPSSRLLLIS